MGTPRLTTCRHVLVKTSSGGCAVQDLATTDLFEHKVGPSVPTHVLMWDEVSAIKYLCAPQLGEAVRVIRSVLFLEMAS